jgi:hypothetical protein
MHDVLIGACDVSALPLQERLTSAQALGATKYSAPRCSLSDRLATITNLSYTFVFDAYELEMAGKAPLIVPALKRHTATVIVAHGLGDSGAGW